MSELSNAGPLTPASAARKHLPAWIIILAFIALAGFLGIIGVGLKRTQQGPILVGQAVPPITLTLFDGSTINTADLRGKVVVLNFWASWCVPCEQEAADLEQAWQLYKDGGQVVFLGVDYLDVEPKAMQYLDKFGITYLNGPDLRTRISQTFRTTGVPETYIIDRSGNLAAVKVGPYLSLAEIQQAIDPLLE